ncbi:transcriptional regulator [Clostridium gelidum]|uniref:Transcriptional regulator n=1 Tax=Clostridium gelidum TaxID=704125 RepID=A0ABN6IVL1_9CLOT|nr:AraC family transcriptional regulator [Clostridium gelidum]BCZ45453.1 transcriptional regulator [Clostridium gelidum]
MSEFISIQMSTINSKTISKNLTYEEIYPSKEMCNTVLCYFTLFSKEIERRNYTMSLIPDGCINILIDLNEEDIDKSISILGPITSSVNYEIDNSVNIFGIRILPGKLSELINIPMKFIVNKQFLLKDVISDFCKYIPKNAQEIDNKMLMSSIDNYTLEFFENTPSCKNKTVISNLIRYIYDKKGQVSIEELSKVTNYSTRNLSRISESEIGINLKLFCRIVRFQNMLYSIKDKRDLNWKSVALENGYYDQSHLVKEFKFFCGISPTLFK